MRVLVTGREGQLARSLAERAGFREGIELVFAARPELDLSAPDTIEAAVRAARPDVVINAAAYTAVDAAEDDEDAARVVNGRAPGVLAAAARRAGARMIQVSTDYVFDGLKDGSYLETDPTGPQGVYGATKLEGERAALAEGATVTRTAWVYSPFGRNFVATMLSLAKTRDELGVVDDQRGSPTSALDLADALLGMLDVWRSAPTGLGRGEVYHCAGSGEASWADLAVATFEASAAVGGPAASVRRIGTRDFPTRARRPGNSRLDCGKLLRDFGVTLPGWRESARGVAQRVATAR